MQRTKKKIAHCVGNLGGISLFKRPNLPILFRRCHSTKPASFVQSVQKFHANSYTHSSHNTRQRDTKHLKVTLLPNKPCSARLNHLFSKSLASFSSDMRHLAMQQQSPPRSLGSQISSLSKLSIPHSAPLASLPFSSFSTSSLSLSFTSSQNIISSIPIVRHFCQARKKYSRAELEEIQEKMKYEELMLRLSHMGISSDEVEEYFEDLRDDNIPLKKKNEMLIETVKAIYKADPLAMKSLEKIFKDLDAPKEAAEETEGTEKSEKDKPTPKEAESPSQSKKKTEPVKGKATTGDDTKEDTKKTNKEDEVEFMSPTFEKAYKMFKRNEPELKAALDRETEMKSFPQVEHANPEKIKIVNPQKWPIVDTFFPDPNTPPGLLQAMSRYEDRALKANIFKTKVNHFFFHYLRWRRPIFSMTEPEEESGKEEFINPIPSTQSTWISAVLAAIIVLVLAFHAWGRRSLTEKENHPYLLYPPKK